MTSTHPKYQGHYTMIIDNPTTGVGYSLHTSGCASIGVFLERAERNVRVYEGVNLHAWRDSARFRTINPTSLDFSQLETLLRTGQVPDEEKTPLLRVA